MQTNNLDCTWQQQIKMLFASCNKNFFNGELLEVPFFIDSRKKEMFCFTAGKGIFCGHSILTCNNLEQFIISFFHELIHIYHFQNGILDLSSNNYHNKHFLKKANSIGFFVYSVKNKGFVNLSIINLGNKGFIPKGRPNNFLIDFLNKTMNKNLIESLNLLIKKALLEKIDSRKSKEFFLKYECKCPKPHNSIRSGRRPDSKNALQIHCKNCNSDFFCVSELK